MSNSLTPHVITDKNGRMTTVYRKPETASAAKAIPAVHLQAHDVLKRDKYAQAYESMLPAAREMQLKRERLESGREDKEAIISRIDHLVTQTGRDSLTVKMDRQYLEVFPLMESLIAQSQENPEFREQMFERYHQITGDAFLAWAKVADTHYAPIVSSAADDHRTPERLPSIFSAMICLNDRQRRTTGSDYSEQQERNYSLLTLAAWDSRLDGRINRQGSGWGSLTFYENDDLEEFAFACTDQELVHKVCKVMSEGVLTRFNEMVAVAEGSSIVPLADGAL